MKFIKWIKRITITPLHCTAGDSLSLYYTKKNTSYPIELISEPITKSRTFTEVGIFNAEVDGKPAIGGVFIE
jgi:hypothetical protein